MSVATPSREDFAALLEESFAKNDLAEGYVTKGIVTGIEKDVAVVDVGLKGRRPHRAQGIRRARQGWPAQGWR
ncbi:ribosomal protein S1 [Rhizobium redzepovicii]